MGHTDIIFDNTVELIKQLIEYHSIEKKYYLCTDEETVSLFAEIFRKIGLMDLFWPSAEDISYCNNVDWEEYTINFIKDIYDEL